MRHFFIIPTLSCDASCQYCFTRRINSPIMSRETFLESLRLVENLGRETDAGDLDLCFHGGEPLLAGFDFYKQALPAIRKNLGQSVRLSLQSNLWNLTDDFCKLFFDYQVRVGTSLDGPEQVNDRQRGPGYFKKTMEGIHLLHKHGMNTGCIAAFTSHSAAKVNEVFEFFLKNTLSFSVHCAVKPIQYNGDQKLFLSAEGFERVLIQLLDLYLENANKIRISTLDDMIKNIAREKSGLCTFSRCIGNYIAVSSEGGIYPCNRFAGMKEFSFGCLDTIHSFSDIERSGAWGRLMDWQSRIDKECRDCFYKAICHGGCPYAGHSTNQREPARDPLCRAYRGVYQHILDQGTADFFSEPYQGSPAGSIKKIGKSSFFRKTTLLRMMGDFPHPYDCSRASKEILAAALFGITDDIDLVANTFVSLGLTTSGQRALHALQGMYRRLKKPACNPNNLYLHVTERCNLPCTHCYAPVKNSEEAVHFPFPLVPGVIIQAKEAGFRKVVITGGEPLLYPGLKLLLSELIKLRKSYKLPILVLRTNLTPGLDKETVQLLENAFDQVVVSLDGSEEYHDRRRGRGTYRKTISNIELFNPDVLGKKVGISSVFSSNDLDSAAVKKEQESVEQVKERYNLNHTRFQSLLPLGRAKSYHLRRLPVSKIGIEEWIQNQYIPRPSCGLGQVLMICPDGNVYPCHVFMNRDHLIGNVMEQSILDLMHGETCTQLRTRGVDSDMKCKACRVRYVCGGTCRAWAGQDCNDLFERARFLVQCALDTLDISRQDIRKYVNAKW